MTHTSLLSEAPKKKTFFFRSKIIKRLKTSITTKECQLKLIMIVGLQSTCEIIGIFFYIYILEMKATLFFFIHSFKIHRAQSSLLFRIFSGWTVKGQGRQSYYVIIKCSNDSYSKRKILQENSPFDKLNFDKFVWFIALFLFLAQSGILKKKKKKTTQQPWYCRPYFRSMQK